MSNKTNTLSHDDLSETQEYFIAGIVILLFGLLYWFLNHGWNSDNKPEIANDQLPESTISATTSSTTQRDTELDLKTAAFGTTAIVAAKPETSTSNTAINTHTPQTNSESSHTKEQTSHTDDNDAAVKTENGNEGKENTLPSSSPLALTTAEVAKLREAKEALIKTQKTTNQAAKETQGQATTINTLESLASDKIQNTPEADKLIGKSESAESKSRDPNDNNNKKSNHSGQANLYSLPDGTPVNISAKGFEGKFRDAIINHQLHQPITFDSIYFKSGSTTLNKKSEQQLRATAALLHRHSETHILLRGHTDSVGGVNRNVQLSLYRANETALALGELGIDTQRIRILGVGATEPIASNKTKKGRSKNRRIEILITKQPN